MRSAPCPVHASSDDLIRPAGVHRTQRVRRATGGPGLAARRVSCCSSVQLTYPAGVFVAACPMAGIAHVPEMLGAPLSAILPSHTMVLLIQHGGTCFVLDFLPEKPTSKMGAFTLLRGGAVPGASTLCARVHCERWHAS